MGLWNTVFGNGPAIPTISRAEIENALRGRGYIKGVYREVAVPMYSKTQAIRMGVDAALSQIGLPTKPATRTTLEPTRWTSLVDGALLAAQTAIARTERRRELTGAEALAQRGV